MFPGCPDSPTFLQGRASFVPNQEVMEGHLLIPLIPRTSSDPASTSILSNVLPLSPSAIQLLGVPTPLTDGRIAAE